MSRLPLLPPEGLTPDQAALYDSVARGPRAQGPQHFALTRPDGSLAGPFNAFLHSPGLGEAVQRLGAAVRYETAFTGRERELAILIVAAHWDSAFERQAHEGVGRAAGLTEPELEAVRAGGVPELEDAAEAAAANLAFAMSRGDVSEEEWQRWAGALDDRQLFELSTLVGYYALLALQLRVFRV